VATIKGRIKAISVSTQKGTRKTNIPRAQLQVDHGIVGDAHAGNWHRQVSLLGIESIEDMVAKGASVSPGDFAENITTEGIDLNLLKTGDKMILGGGIELEITQIGKRCHRRCEIFEQLGDCVMPHEGAFAKVIKGGTINTGDEIVVIYD
jgi:MOSC domain-containing protein YiiM